ncbi:MAG: DNA-processing protein DprA [Saccharofermentans sp.]|nr:DNA-processing protein DprA [Saccharofermentans sp.]
MDNNSILDCQYTALKMKGGLAAYTVDELLEKKIIRSHRELVPDNLAYILDLAYRNDISRKTINNLEHVVNMLHDCISEAREYVRLADSHDIKVISAEDEEYPYPWRQLTGMPRVFFAKGHTEFLKDIFTCGSAALVGSRNPGRYSMYATEQFVKDLCEHGVVVVSGLALGIDGQAHRVALDSGGKTIAVTPGGVDVHYPFQHDALYTELYERGLVISEMPPSQGIIKQYFPARNRLISALSDVCLIMEAGKYSGTLHTASYAGAQGKDVFVLPNSIYSENCIGGLMLIKDGAEPLIESTTLLDRIKGIVLQRVKEDGENYPELIKCNGSMAVPGEDLVGKMKASPESLEKDEWKSIIKIFVEEKPRNFDELSKLVLLDTGRLMSLLTEMEFDREVETDRDKYVLTIQKN